MNLAIGYRHFIKGHFSISVESKFSLSTKGTDMNIGLPIGFGYHF
jgi:hypothetical protein